MTEPKKQFDDGGLAFPVTGPVYNQLLGTIEDKTVGPGMSLWAYFAAHVPSEFIKTYMDRGNTKTNAEHAAECAAQYADAMIAEMRKRECKE